MHLFKQVGAVAAAAPASVSSSGAQRADIGGCIERYVQIGTARSAPAGGCMHIGSCPHTVHGLGWVVGMAGAGVRVRCVVEPPLSTGLKVIGRWIGVWQACGCAAARAGKQVWVRVCERRGRRADRCAAVEPGARARGWRRECTSRETGQRAGASPAAACTGDAARARGQAGARRASLCLNGRAGGRACRCVCSRLGCSAVVEWRREERGSGSREGGR